MVVAPDDVEELYEDAPCGFVTARVEGTILRVNRTFERWTGHDRAALVGARRFQDLLTPGGRIYHETHYLPLLQMQGAVREIAVEIECSDGRRLPALVNSVLREGIIRTTVFDATDRRRYERELLAARERAERLQRHATLLADTSRVIDEVPGLAARAQGVVDLLAQRAGVSAVLTTGEVTVSAGSRADDPALRAAVELAARGEAPPPADGDAIAAVPLRIQGRALGALGVVRAAAGDAFAADDLPLFVDLAERVALAIETARLYDDQRDIALALQRAMLADELPADPRVRVAAHYSPAVDTLEVGGDWYDAFPIDDDRIAIVVGDVVGRGLEAAATMGQLRSAVRALAGTRTGPAGVLTRLDAFVELTEVARSATVAYAELSLDDGTLSYACAGHPPPMTLAPGGEPDTLWGGRSSPLGAFTRVTAREEAVTNLAPGARLLLYTDGVVESRERPIDAGMAQLLAAFGAHAGSAVEDLAERLSSALLAGGGGGTDDRCLLVLERADGA